MRKILLLATICLAFIYADAQQANKSLLNAKWNLSAMSAGGFTFHKDSMQQDIIKIVLSQTHDTKVDLGHSDSLKLMKAVAPIFNKLFKTYAKFDADGRYTLILYGMGSATKRSGKYEWTDDGNLLTKSAKDADETFLVTRLTADKLVLTSDNDKTDKDHIELSFTRE